MDGYGHDEVDRSTAVLETHPLESYNVYLQASLVFRVKSSPSAVRHGTM
jgi:hypothetical protein